METQSITEVLELYTNIGERCPDFDDDCKFFTYSHANWCFLGCRNHPCNPDEDLGIAKGYCPMLQTQN